MNTGRGRLPLALGLLAGIFLCSTPALSKNNARGTPCPPGRYLVRGMPLGIGQAADRTASVLIGQRNVSIGTACSHKRPKRMNTNKKGVKKVSARWRACDGLGDRVRLRGRVTEDCTRLRGRLRARGFERKFEALLSPAAAALQVAHSCEDVWEAFRRRAIAEMERILDANQESMLEQLRTGCPYPPEAAVFKADGPGMPGGAVMPAVYEVDSSAEEEASSFSTTNTQVEGVDEADFVKNDGAYIYILADGALQIIDAWPPEQAHTVSSTGIEGEPKKLFVHEERAIVYSSLAPISGNDPSFHGAWEWRHGFQECTYGYDCDFVGDGRISKITVLDISNRAEPKLLRETEFEGSYLNSRRIGDAVYTAVLFPEVSFPELSYWPEELAKYIWRCDVENPYDAGEIKTLFGNLRNENTDKIRQASTSEFMPRITDVRYVDGAPVYAPSPLVSCQDYFISEDDDGMNLVSLLAFDMGALDDYEATTIAGRPGAVYASPESLYVATRQYLHRRDTWYFSGNGAQRVEEATTIHKFVLEPEVPASRYTGSGVVKGHILNQFSMDEHQDHLRIATTSGAVRGAATHSTDSFVAARTGGLEVVGHVDNIAPTEDVRSARFHRNVGFIVTFKKTDPLFVFDLSDPTDPRIKGDLKIPGFSTYLHLMDDEHLLTIGYDADDQGSFAWFSGIQLQIIDVSDLSDPRLIHKEVIGTRGSTSDAATNHLAFNYFASRGLLAIPMVICDERSGAGSYGESMIFSGLLVYRVTAGDGFEGLGGVPHESPLVTSRYATACSNWWTEANSRVKRSIFMDDFVYSIAMDRINISSLDDLEHPVAAVELTE